MTTAIQIIAAVVTLGALYFAVKLILGAYLRYRGTRVVTCPETGGYVAVEVDAKHAALTTPLGEPDLRLRSCTRWPEKQDCGQDCLWQIEHSPESCLAETMIDEWYQGKTCVYCGKGFKDLDWLDNKPALVSPDLKTVEWREVQPERIPEVLATHKAVCYDCHVAEGFRLHHPELVVDRPWHRGSHGEYRP